MAAKGLLKTYLQFKELNKGHLKDTLSDLLDKADEENAEYVLTQLKADIEAVAGDNVSPKLKIQYAVHYLDNIFAEFNKEAEMTRTPSTTSEFEKEKAAVAVPKPKSKKRDQVAHRNPFSTKMVASCPSCRKHADVSKLCLDVQKRIRCPDEKCNAKHSIKKWFCKKCSKQGIKKRNDGRKAQITILNCDCYADELSRQGAIVLKCPLSGCGGWRHNVETCPPAVDKRGASMRRKCDVCGCVAALLNWNCAKCSQKGDNIRFTNCACGKKVRKPLYKKTQKLMKKSKIQLLCPQPNCAGRQACEEKEFPWLKKVRTMAKMLRCRKCKKRRCAWEWHCYKCNMIQFNCKCKRPAGNTSTNAFTPQTPVL